MRGLDLDLEELVDRDLAREDAALERREARRLEVDVAVLRRRHFAFAKADSGLTATSGCPDLSVAGRLRTNAPQSQLFETARAPFSEPVTGS
jgi:hypothetical protein